MSTDAANTDKKPNEDITDVITPKAESKVWVIGGEEYVQKPLSYFGKMEFLSRIGGTIDMIMSSDNPLRSHDITQMQAMVQNPDQDFETIVKTLGKLLTYAPGLLEDCYCIWLNIPRGERAPFIDQMRLPADEGGLSDDDGFGILETFVDQNADVMVDFFMEKLPGVAKRIKGLIDTRSQQSKPSKPTRRNILKR